MVITAIVSGLIGALWLGIKLSAGKLRESFRRFVIGFLVLVAVLIEVSALYFKLVAWPSYQTCAGRWQFRGGRTMSLNASEASIEAELKTKGMTAPRVKPEEIDAQIVSDAFYVFPGTTLTICALTLRNGYIVTGESAAASPVTM